MKKYPAFFYFFIFLIFFSAINLYALEGPESSYTAQSYALEKLQSNVSKYQFFLTVEIGYADNSDMDKWTEKYARDFANYEKASWLVSDASTSMEDTGTMTFGVDTEFRYFPDCIGFGAGSGYHFCRSKCVVNGESIFSITDSEMGHISLTLHVIPVTGTLYYRIPFYSSGFFLIGAGAGYYAGFMKAKAVNEGNAYQTSELNNSYNSEAIGYHAKLEYNRLLNNSFFGCGVTARHAEFKKFEDDSNNTLKLNNKDLKAGLTGVSLYISAGTNL